MPLYTKIKVHALAYKFAPPKFIYILLQIDKHRQAYSRVDKNVPSLTKILDLAHAPNILWTSSVQRLIKKSEFIFLAL